MKRTTRCWGPVLTVMGAATIASIAFTGCAQVKGAVGIFPGDRGRAVVVIHTGTASPDELLADVRVVVHKVAADGATLEVLMMHGGSAGSMIPVPFSDLAGNGRFMPTSKNSKHWPDEAAAFENAAMADIAKQLGPRPKLDATGADLAGAVRRAIEAATKLNGAGPLQAVLVTGGGAHQAADVDLVRDHVTKENAAELAQLVPQIDTRGVAVKLVGIGRFPGIAVDQAFADGVIAWWQEVCSECTFT